jgi:hypothetical protein
MGKEPAIGSFKPGYLPFRVFRLFQYFRIYGGKTDLAVF